MTAAQHRRLARSSEALRVAFLAKGNFDMAERELRKACRHLEAAASIRLHERDETSAARAAGGPQ